MGVMETRFAEIIWENAPLRSQELVALAEQNLGWKKSTTFTVLRRLCEKGIFQNEKSIVSPLMSRDEYAAVQSEQFVEETFAGSLPAFLAAFTAKRKLSEEDIRELRWMIEEQ